MVVLSFIHGSASSWLVVMMRHESKAESFHHSSQRTEDCGIDSLEASMHVMALFFIDHACTDSFLNLHRYTYSIHASYIIIHTNKQQRYSTSLFSLFAPCTYLSMVLSCLFADRMNPCNREIIIVESKRRLQRHTPRQIHSVFLREVHPREKVESRKGLHLKFFFELFQKFEKASSQNASVAILI